MAEIHVERKRGAGAWVWVLLLVIIIAAVCWYLWHAGYIHLSMSPVVQNQFARLAVGGWNGA